MKTLDRERQATIREAMTYGEVPSYAAMIVMSFFIFSVMFAVMGFTHSDTMGMMGVIGLIASVVFGVIGVRLAYKHCRELVLHE